MITLYGVANTRTRRNLWFLEELAIPYELFVVKPRDESSQRAEYRAINPMGKVPTLVDDGLVVTESMAINFYLARKYGQNWWPDATAAEAALFQWTFFSATEIDPLFFTIIYETLIKPADSRINAAADQALRMLERPMAYLDSTLESNDYLLGQAFTLADLNVAGVCTMGRRIDFDFSRYARVSTWLERCWDRPAFKRADAMG